VQRHAGGSVDVSPNNIVSLRYLSRKGSHWALTPDYNRALFRCTADVLSWEPDVTPGSRAGRRPRELRRVRIRDPLPVTPCRRIAQPACPLESRPGRGVPPEPDPGQARPGLAHVVGALARLAGDSGQQLIDVTSARCQQASHAR
jgi:hypothetical protein